MIETLIALSTIDNRVVEVLKRLVQARVTLSEQTLADLSMIAGLVVGVLLALIGSTNALVAFPFLHSEPLIGVVFTGLLIGGGSSAIHEFLDLANSLKDIISTPSVSITQTSTEHTGGGDTTVTKVETTAPVNPPPGANAS